MKTIKQYVEAGVLSLDELKSALQLAMQLEFATIPPYLCAQWSINRDPDGVEGTLQRIVVQEMYHFALAGNLLAAIGGRPKIASAEFMPSYPANTLPGGIVQKIPVDLKPLTREQLQVFMQIEYPDFPPVAVRATAGPPTIGAFYDTIIKTLETLQPGIDQTAHAVDVPSAQPLKTIADAIAAIERIKREGEGLQDSPEQPSGERSSLAHYYLFKELFVGKRLVNTGGKWDFTGSPIQLPDVYDFHRSSQQPSPTKEFREVLSKMLVDLETCWTKGNHPPVGTMFQLKMVGQGLIKNGIGPEFLWESSNK